jgi:hypothetical protein
MSDGNALIELGKLAEPAKVLIEKVSDAIGGIFKPYQIKRIAKAEVQAEIIRAEGQIAISEIQQRGLERLIYQEGKKQQNIEDITAKALPLLEDNSNPNSMSEDWISNFFDKCSNVSDEEMQTLWGKVLAGEANKGGSFNKRAVNAIANLEKEDANLFTSLCRFGVFFGEFTPLIFDSQSEIYLKNDINFKALTHLESIGLITFGHSSGFRKQALPAQFVIQYFDQRLLVTLKQNESELKIGKVILTDIGKQLSTICGAEKIEEFPAFISSQWKDRITLI